MRMSFPFFISRRYTFSKKDSRFISFISGITITGIALGVATLIIAVSILDGFEESLKGTIIEFDSHIKITSRRNILPDYQSTLAVLREELFESGRSINPYAANLTIIGNKRIKDGVTVKGINTTDDWSGIEKNIIDGDFNLSQSPVPGIVIGKKLASKLLAAKGDIVTVFALKNNRLPSADNLPNIEKFRITGIFESGMSDYDDLTAYVDLKEAQRLFSIGDNINGIDIRVKDISKIDSLSYHLTDILPSAYVVRSIYQIHRNIFTWIDLQKEPIPIILGLIIIVAVFNIIGTLLMIVLEKTHAVGVLKSLGAGRSQIVSIFIYQGILLAAAGIVIGNIAAFLLLQLQLQYEIISLPSSVYLMSSVPIKLTFETFLGISVLTLLMSCIASIIPSYIASRILPVSALRFS